MTGHQIYDAKVNKIEKRNRQFYISSWRLQDPTHSNKLNNQKEVKKLGNLTHVKHIPPNNNSMHIFLKCTGDIFQERL